MSQSGATARRGQHTLATARTESRERGVVAEWGDDYGNRVDRFLSATAYLDGRQPSAIFARGYYTRSVLWAVDFDGEQLSERWVFDSDDEGDGGYAGQGNHQLSVA